MIHWIFDFSNATYTNLKTNTYRFFKSNYFEKYSDSELIDTFNNEVWNSWWVSARAEFLSLLHNEFINRWYDFSIIWDENSISYMNKIELIEINWIKTIIIDNDNFKTIHI